MQSGSSEEDQVAKNKAVHKAAKPKQASTSELSGSHDGAKAAAGKTHGKGKPGDSNALKPSKAANISEGVPRSLS